MVVERVPGRKGITGRVRGVAPRVRADDIPQEGVFDFEIGKPERIPARRAALTESVDRQIPCLVKKRNALRVGRLVVAELRLFYVYTGEVYRTRLQDVDEERRHRGFGPVVGELAILQAFAERNRVYDRLCIFLELVPVIPFDDFCKRSVIRQTVRLRERVYSLGEIPQHLFVRVAEQHRDIRVHRPVVEVVEVGEYRHLGELADAGEEREALLRLKRLDDGVERLEGVAEFRDVRLHQMSEERLVVLVDEQHHLSVGRLRGKGVDEIREKNGRYVTCQFANVEFGRAAMKMSAKQRPELGDIRRLHRAHVEMQDGPLLRPVPLRLNGQIGEPLALALEKRLQSGDGERLPEPTRTRDEELVADVARRHGIQGVRLVDVRKAVLPQFRERVDVCRNLLHGKYYSKKIIPAWSRAQRHNLPKSESWPKALPQVPLQWCASRRRRRCR